MLAGDSGLQVESGGPKVIKLTVADLAHVKRGSPARDSACGRADFDWRSEALICRLTVPLGVGVVEGTTIAIWPRPSASACTQFQGRVADRVR